MKWINKYYNFENSLLDELNTYYPKYTSFDLSGSDLWCEVNGHYFDSDKCISLEWEEINKEFGGWWVLKLQITGDVVFPDIEDIYLKCEIMDYIKENYELS